MTIWRQSSWRYEGKVSPYEWTHVPHGWWMHNGVHFKPSIRRQRQKANLVNRAGQPASQSKTLSHFFFFWSYGTWKLVFTPKKAILGEWNILVRYNTMETFKKDQMTGEWLPWMAWEQHTTVGRNMDRPCLHFRCALLSLMRPWEYTSDYLNPTFLVRRGVERNNS